MGRTLSSTAFDFDLRSAKPGRVIHENQKPKSTSKAAGTAPGTVSQPLFRPFGTRSRSILPAAYAAGFILAPLRGFAEPLLHSFVRPLLPLFVDPPLRFCSRPWLGHISRALYRQNSYSVSTQLNFPSMRFAGQQIGNCAGDIDALDRSGVIENKYPLFAS